MKNIYHLKKIIWIRILPQKNVLIIYTYTHTERNFSNNFFKFILDRKTGKIKDFFK